MELSQKILSDITVFMKYAKYLPQKQRRETWTELVDRNKNMHLQKFPQLSAEIEEAYKMVYDKKILPSMRSLQFAGKPIELTPSRLYNCCALPIDDWRAFSEIMFLLLGGSGVGFSVQNHHVEKLPEINKPRNRQRRWLIADSIEGWADAVKILMKSYFFGGSKIVFDYGDIRAKGVRLVTSGGKAPGPQPLKECLTKIEGILDSKANGDKLRPIDVHDIACLIADSVLAGGIRRAALISLFSADDDEMISAKSGNWWEQHPHRARANNSAVLLRHKLTSDYFLNLWKRIELSNAGEPGIYLSNDKDWLTNPCCFTGDMKILTVDGYVPLKSMLWTNNSLYKPLDLKKFVNVQGETVVGRVYSTGFKQVIKLNLSNGKTIRCTREHRFMLSNGDECIAEQLIGRSIRGYGGLSDVIVNSIEIGEVEEVFDFTFDDNTHWGVIEGCIAHNCEIALRPYQFCNLVEVNSSDIVDQSDLNNRVSAASFIGTLQASYTDFHYLRPIWQRTTEKDALIGVSMTGIGSNKLNGLNLTEAANIVTEVNAKISKTIGINPASRQTCIKPSGCRPWHGLVTTDEGILTLQEIFVNHKQNTEWSEYTETSNVYQDAGVLQKIKKTYHNGIDDVYSVKLEGQIELQCTKNHPWFVVNNYDRKNKNRYTTINNFVKTEDLKSGDILDIKLGVYQKNTSYKFKFVNMFNIRMRENTTEITQPHEMTADIAWLLGYLWGDGSLSEHKYRIRFTDQNQFNLEKANDILRRYFNVSGNIVKCNNKNAYTLDIGSIQLYHWFSQNGIRKYFNNNIDVIPECVRRSSYTDIIAFIAGLVDSDGTVHKQKNAKYINVMISQKYSFFTRHLQDVAASVGIHFNHSFNTRGDSFAKIKNMVLMSLTSFSSEASVEIFSEHCEKYKRLNEIEQLPIINKSIATAKQILGKVLSVDVIGKMETYDIEIENEPWFYAGAVKSHNTTSCVLGTSSGIHAWHNDYYIRRIRVNKNEAIYTYLSIYHPNLVEDEYFRPHDTAVISIPQKAPEGSIFRTESPIDMLERIKKCYVDWVKPGHIDGQNTHNISATVSIKPDEWESVGNWMWENKDYYNGLSVLPYDNGSYIQAPFTDCTKEEYDNLIQSLTEIDLTKVVELDDNTDLTGELACSSGNCEIK